MPPRSRFVMTDEFAELWLVLWVCGGRFVASSIVRMVQGHGTPFVFDGSRVFALLGTEAVLAIGFVPFLRTRGWTLRRVTEPWQARDMARAVGIFAALWAIDIGVNYAELLFGLPSPTPAAGVRGSLPWLLIISLSTLNPLFEEFLYLGFAFNALKRYGVGVAVGFAVCLRVAIHLYQGPSAIPAHVLFAVLLTIYYVRTRRLWPVIVAHGLIDVVAFAGVYLRGSV